MAALISAVIALVATLPNPVLHSGLMRREYQGEIPPHSDVVFMPSRRHFFHALPYILQHRGIRVR